MPAVEIHVKLSDGNIYIISTILEYTVKDIQKMSKDKLDSFSMFIQRNAKNGTDCMIKQLRNGGVPNTSVWLNDTNDGTDYDSLHHHFST